MTDSSHGYESISVAWLAARDHHIGVNQVRSWARTLPGRSSVLDIGCGSGLPLTAVLLEEDLDVFAIDAAPSLVAAFRRNLPGVPVLCESVLDSSLFDRQFHAVLSIGLIFLLTPGDQHRLIHKFADALLPGGHLLFTAPAQTHTWTDIMTGLPSTSLGAPEYRRQLAAVGLSVTREYDDEAQNHYFEALRTANA